MKQDIYINSTPQESRIALMEDGELTDLLIERRQERGIVGNIYKGKVGRVLAGMQAAFCEIGMEKAGFLHVSDFFPVEDSGSALLAGTDNEIVVETPKPVSHHRRLPIEKQ